MVSKTISEIYNDLVMDKDNWIYPWLREIIELSLEYLMLNGLSNVKREHEIPDEIQEIVIKNMTMEDIKFIKMIQEEK